MSPNGAAMSVKPWVAFTTNLADDQVENGQEIFVLGGRNVAVAIGEVFTRLGCQASPPESAGELGWEFDLLYKGSHPFWCRVTSFYPSFHLLFEGAPTLLTAKKNAAAHAELAERFAAALRDDPRFQHVSWWSLKDGPPEPEDVTSAAANTGKPRKSADPIDHDSRAEGRPAWGCLALAIWVLLSGVAGAVMAVMGLIHASLGEMLFSSAMLIFVGFVGLIRASAERVYK